MPKKVEKRSFTDVFEQEQQRENQTPEAVGDEGVEEEEEGGSQAIVILHPGSSTLHLGLSTDPTPHSIPHIIAYRNVHTGSVAGGIGNGNGADSSMEVDKHEVGRVDESLVLKYNVEMTPEVESHREEGVASILDCLDACRIASSMVDYKHVNKDEYISHNGRVQPVARESEDLALTDVSAQPKFVIGNDALYLPVDADYSLMKPMHHLTLRDASLSLSNIFSMLEDLWTKALEDYLEVSKKDFKFYRVILIVPDIVERPILKEFMNLLLLRMEFAAAFLHQESVCAAYCAGLSSACIVNIGDEMTSICCVEDGMSNPNTRLALRYGGSDITRLLHWLLQQTNFPYMECHVDSRLSGVLIQHLKESICHMDPTLWGTKDYQFSVMTPKPGILHDYEIKLADETILAPLGVFFPQAFCLPSNVALMRGQEVSPANNEDLFDEAHWTTEVGGAGGGAQNKITNAEGVVIGSAGVAGELPEVTKRLQGAEQGLVFGLDQAVHLSIDCASSLEVKQKLYGGILIVGGGLAFPGAANLMQSRLELKQLTIFPRSGNNIEVFANPRDLESSFVVWKGAAVLSCLDTGQELWIERPEWEFSGVRLLRERAPFSW